MDRTYGTLSKTWALINGLKPVVIKWFEPTALAREGLIK